jgi:non-ribosomal peptide synthase protein (TIGR01720 family)
VHLATRDARGLADPASVEAALASASREAHARIDLAEGPVLVATYLDRGELGGRLVLVGHHLVIDGVSWRIVTEDLERAYRQLERGEPVDLGDKTTSFGRWSERLGALVADPEKLGRSYWRAVAREAEPVRIPVDRADGGTPRMGTREAVALVLPPAETRRLLTEGPEAFCTQINDVLLTALMEGFWRWKGLDQIVVGLEGHGREDLFADVDLSRTVGWFTSMFPVVLRRTGKDVADRIKWTKEMLRQIPQRGIGYAVLRHLGEDAVLAASGDPELVFNYLGQLDAGQAGGALFGGSPEQAPVLWDADAPTSLMVVDCFVRAGELHVTWNYSVAHYDRATIDVLAGAYLASLSDLIASSAAGLQVGYTPSDFELAQVSQDELDRALAGGSGRGKGGRGGSARRGR